MMLLLQVMTMMMEATMIAMAAHGGDNYDNWSDCRDCGKTKLHMTGDKTAAGDSQYEDGYHYD